MNSKAKNVLRKHRKAKKVMAMRRREGLATQAAIRASRRRRKPIIIEPVIVNE